LIFFGSITGVRIASAACLAVMQVELGGSLGEVVLGRGLDAIGAVTEVRQVQVLLEDLVLGELLFDGHRVAQLGDLALVGLGGRSLHLLGGLCLLDQTQLHELLGDARTTLGHAAVALVADQRAQGPLRVQCAVLIEAVVLDRDDRLAHDRGDLG
jgi:hypothetical protein